MALSRWFGAMARKPLTPPWQSLMYRDPFDYTLRSIEEVKREIQQKPPIDLFKVSMSSYRDSDPKAPDPREPVVKVEVDMRNWHLTKLQHRRLAFLLGPRYQSHSTTFKVVSRQFNSQEQNLQRCKDIIAELYLECKRAP